jgi:hypothetical protein
MDFEFDLKNLSWNPSGWLDAGKKKLKETEVSFELPKIRVPDSVTVGGGASKVSFDGGTMPLLIGAAVVAYFIFR